MTVIDLAFAVTSTDSLPVDHGYHLYGALSRLLPALHAESGVAVHPLRGTLTGPRQLALQPWTRLTLRTDAARIADLLPLAGKSLRVGPATLRVGVPEVRPLTPAPTLRSRLVTIRNGTDPDRFQRELRRKLEAFRVSSEARIHLPVRQSPPRQGEPIRRTVRIKEKEVVGFEVVVEGLTAEESLALQENRIPDPALRFSRNHMGCGVFVPVKAEEA